MKASVHMVTDTLIEKYKALTEDEYGFWCVIHLGKVHSIEEDEEEALETAERINEEPESFGGQNLSFGSNLQCDDGDDEYEDDGGVYGEGLYSNTDDAWSDEEPPYAR
jgi:hydrogenase maturation factor